MSAPKGGTVQLTSSGNQHALELPEDTDIIIDLNGNTLTSVGPFVGSEETQTNAFRFLANSNITIKNGTLKCIAPGVAILIQNFANLTLDNVTLKGKSFYQYLLSNNFGNVILKNGTTINGNSNCVPFDCHYGLSAEYDEGLSVTVEDASVKINGTIEYTKEDRIADVNQFYQKAHVYIARDCNIAAPEGYEFVDMADGNMKELKPV